VIRRVSDGVKSVLFDDSLKSTLTLTLSLSRRRERGRSRSSRQILSDPSSCCGYNAPSNLNIEGKRCA
jgi:hypothetical protein